MTARTVLGPHGYSRPPYGSFAGKPLDTGPARTYTQTFTVLGPHGYSRPPYGSFAGRTPQVSSTPKAGWIAPGKRKRWWEELQDEYIAQYEREDRKLSRSKKAVAARVEVEELAEQVFAAGLLTDATAPVLAEMVVKTVYAPRLDETLEYAKAVREYLERLYQEDEDELILMLSM